jgi:hypothetical protein
MKKPEERVISYIGYNKPENKDELEFEILGLQNAIAKINLKISELRQSDFLASAALKNNASNIDDLFGESDESFCSKNGIEEENRERNSFDSGGKKGT